MLESLDECKENDNIFFLENVTIIEMLDLEIPLFPLSQVAMKNYILKNVYYH